MENSTEHVRRGLVEAINTQAELEPDRAHWEKKHGRIWNTEELQQDFVVTGFMAPFVVVVRKADNVVGSLLFTHSPRYYFGFTRDDGVVESKPEVKFYRWD